MKRYSLVAFALLFPATLAAQVSVTGVTSSPSPPTFADAITFKIEVVAPSNCVLDEEQIEVEALANRLLLTLPSCLDDGSRPIATSLAKLVEHQLPGIYSEASFLFPWSGGIRRGLTRGYGKVLPNLSAPTQAEASNRTSGDPAFTCQPLQVVRFSLPTSGLLYHVAVGPGGASCITCP